MKNLRNLLREQVKVNAGNLVYEGKLIEATDESLLLKTDNGFINVATERVVSVRSATEEAEDDLASNRFVSRSFYEFDDSE